MANHLSVPILLSTLTLAALASGVSAQTPTERAITFQLPAGKAARGPLLKQPPAQRSQRPALEAPPVPIFDDRLDIAPAPAAETRGEPAAVQAPESVVILRDTALTGVPAGASSRINDPNVGSQGNGILVTHNWYAEVSTDNGATFSYIDPDTLFPSTPSDFSAGFCCTQRVTQDSSRDLILWMLEYFPTGMDETSSNGLRLAVAHGQDDLATNDWIYYDFTPSRFAEPGTILDFPHLQVGANYLYFTANLLSAVDHSFQASIVARVSLSALAAGGSVTVNVMLSPAYGNVMAVNGAQPEGTRPGRTTMYFAAVLSTTSIQVLTWPETDSAPTGTTISGLPAIASGPFACPGPDGRDPCTRADTRMQTGWITDTELGVMFSSAQNGAARPYPYTRVVILDPATLAVLSQPDIFSTTSAWLYPALAVNQRGHLGGTIDNLGGDTLPKIRAVIRDDLSPDVANSGWETVPVAASTAGTVGLWGDYNGAATHEEYPNTWLAAGHVQSGGPDDANAVTHNYWFGRERDTNPTFTVARSGSGTGTVTSSPAGIDCGIDCAHNFALGTTVTLTADPGSFSIFTGWSGACSGVSQNCTVLVDGAKSVTATFETQGSAFTLTVSKAGSGAGTVTSSPAGINCGSTCQATYASGTMVTLTATPDAGSTFTGWSGACTGTGSCTVTMNAARAVTATFGPAGPRGLDFYTVTPCRILDTRSTGPALTSGQPRTIPVTGLCGIPSDAVAVSINVTVVTPGSGGHVTLFPGDADVPATSTLNFNPGKTRANSAVLALASDASGTLAAQASLAAGGQVDLLVDVNGYLK
jgi:hypothetical protein